MPKRTASNSLEDYYDRIAGRHVAPLWERLAQLVSVEPVINAAPYLWNYEALRPVLFESAGLISAEEAERRVLILENPGLIGQSAATNTLYAGLQLIMPGEIAPPHRHTQTALRFIIEGQDAYTSVDGERADMSPGDLVLTPSWSWHHHGHDGQGPVVWLDVLDIPLITAIGSRFVEHLPDDNQTQPETSGKSAPIRYPFDRAREALEVMKANGEWDVSHGVRMEYTDPTTNWPVLPTISAFLQLLPSGFKGARYQSSEGFVYCVVSGHGTVTVETGERERVFSYKPNDVIALPCWCPHSFVANDESVLFSASDRGLQKKLGIWRERRS